MHYLLIFIGLLAVILGWIFAFKIGLIFRLNAWLREKVFTDQVVLFSGRRVAVLLFALGGIALFSGIEQVGDGPLLRPRVAAKLFEKAQKDFLEKDYDQVVLRCREIIKSEPQNTVARELLASALLAIGDKDEANRLISEILAIDPNYPLQKGPLKKIFSARKKGSH